MFTKIAISHVIMKKIIDSHVHLDLIAQLYPERIEWLKENGCGLVSWSYFHEVDSVSTLKTGLKAKALCLHKLSAAGLFCHYLVGIHPRSIPPDLKPHKIAALLEPYLDDPLCLGIGEIGLETGDTKEKEVFSAQLEFGQSLMSCGKIIGVHTPRANKLAITESTLNILKNFPDLSALLVVDHCTAETIEAVLGAGFWAGVTISPIKTSWEDMKRIVTICQDQIDRIMCNTDSGGAFFEDLVQLGDNRDLPDTIRDKIFHKTAARFFRFL